MCVPKHRDPSQGQGGARAGWGHDCAPGDAPALEGQPRGGQHPTVFCKGCVRNWPLLEQPVRRRQRHPTPALLPGESQGRGSPMGCRLWGRTESDTTEVTQQQNNRWHKQRPRAGPQALGCNQLLPHVETGSPHPTEFRQVKLPTTSKER